MATVKSWTASFLLANSIKTQSCHSGSKACLNNVLLQPRSPVCNPCLRSGYHSMIGTTRQVTLKPPTLYNHVSSCPSLTSQSNYRRISGVSGSENSSNGGDSNNNTKGGSGVAGSWAIGSLPNTTLNSQPTTPMPQSPVKVPSGMLWDTLKVELNDKENSQSNIQMNIKKLEAISKVTKRKQAYSPYLWISQLPPTVMPDDIKRMEVTEGSIKDIIYHRNQYFEFLNRVTVVFRSATDAVEFITQKYGKFLGGHKLVMNMLDPYHHRDKKYIPPQLKPEPMSGQLVLVSGLPATSRPDHLRTEFRRFQLMDTTEAAIISVPSRKTSSSSQYLIRLSSRSEAYRFVRTYHNTYFQFSEFRKRCPIRATVIF